MKVDKRGVGSGWISAGIRVGRELPKLASKSVRIFDKNTVCSINRI